MNMIQALFTQDSEDGAKVRYCHKCKDWNMHIGHGFRKTNWRESCIKLRFNLSLLEAKQ